MDSASSSSGLKRKNNDEKTEDSSFKIRKVGDDEKDRAEEHGENWRDQNLQKEEDRRRIEESHFLRLFTLVLDVVITMKDVQATAVQNSIQLIKNSFYVDSGPFLFSKISFTEWENVCGYLYRYGSHDAGFTRYRILNAIKNCEALNIVLRKPNLRIISLGAGPANDAFGLCSALHEFHVPNNVIITLIDKFKEWSLCVKLAKIMIEEGSFGNLSELFQRTNVELSSIEVNLPGDLSSDREYFRSLAEADVIVMSKLISIQSFSERTALIQSLYKHMKTESLILLIDPFFQDAWNNFSSLYCWGSHKQDPYQSTAQAKSRFYCYDDLLSTVPITVLRKVPNDK